jgi:hypothetical protein
MLHLVPFNMANPSGDGGIDRATPKKQEPGQLLTAKQGRQADMLALRRATKSVGDPGADGARLCVPNAAP